MPVFQPAWLGLFVAILLFLTLRSAVVIGVVFAWRRWTAFGRRFRVFDIPLRAGQLRQEALAAVGVLVMDAALFVVPHQFGLLPLINHNPWWMVLLHAGLITLWLEVWFYATHRLLHHPALFWIHAQHHVARVTDPLTSLSFSVLERAVIVGGVVVFVIVLAWLTPVDVRSVMAAGVLNYALNVLGHSNVEFFPRNYAHSRWRHLLITPTYHALHHARFRGNYALYSPLLDRVFGTAFADYPEVLHRTAGGSPLTQLHEREAR